MSICAACGLAESCAGAEPRARGPLVGVSLVLASLIHFLLPAALALTGAALAGGGPVRQLFGGLAGLLLGLLVATAAARWNAASRNREACFEPR